MSDSDSDMDMDDSDSSGDIPSTSTHPQKVLKLNQCMPYADKLHDEALSWFKEIKQNLSKCLILHDFRPGFFVWSSRLESFITHHSYYFSKDDHLQLVHMMYDVLVSPVLDPHLRVRSATMLCLLLRRRDLLSPKELTLHWRPLYEMFDKVEVNNRDDWAGLEFIPENMTQVMHDVLGACREYFPIEATQEILDLFWPMMCPHSDYVLQAMHYFELFLPTMSGAENKDRTFMLWLPSMLDWYFAFDDEPPWEAELTSLLGRAASHTIGLFDWRPYMSKLFDRLLYNLHLPIGRNASRKQANNEVTPSTPIFICALLHFEECYEHLENLLTAVETFLYPSNTGSWSRTLCDALFRIPQGFLDRLWFERYRKLSWRQNHPPEARLTDEHITRFVKLFKPISLIAMFRKSGNERAYAVTSLAVLSDMEPSSVLPDLTDRFFASLDVLHEPQRLISTISALNVCVKNLFNWDKGRSVIIPLLESLLPAIDPNDYRKTLCALNLITCILYNINLYDCSNIDYDAENLTEAERELCSATASFEELSLLILERCLSYLESSSIDSTVLNDAQNSVENIRMNFEENSARFFLFSATTALFIKSSDEISEVLCKRLLAFVTGTVFEQRHFSGATLLSICHNVCRLRPDIVERFVMKKLESLVLSRCEELSSEIKDVEKIDNETLWLFAVFLEMVTGHKSVVMRHLSSIKTILRCTLNAKSRPMAHNAAMLFRSAATALLTFQPDFSEIRRPKTNLPFREWGKLILYSECKPKWSAPDEETIGACQDLVDEFLATELDFIDAYVANGDALKHRELEQRLFNIDRFVSGCTMYALNEEEEADRLKEVYSAVPFKSVYGEPDSFVGCKPQGLMIRGVPFRRAVYSVMNRLQEKLLASDSDDVQSFKELVQIYRTLIVDRGKRLTEFALRHRTLIGYKPYLFHEYGDRRYQLAHFHVEKIVLHYERRLVDQKCMIFNKLRYDIAQSVFNLSISRYRIVRSQAQNLFSDILYLFKYASPLFLDRILNAIEEGKKEHENDDESKLKGALFLMCEGKSRSWLLRHNWKAIRKVWPAMIRAESKTERTTVPNLFAAAADKMEKYYTTTLVYQVWNDKLVENGLKFLQNGSWPLCDSDVVTEKEIEKAKLYMGETNKESATLYNGLVAELVEIINERKLKLLHLLFAEYLLTLLPRREIQFPPEATHCLLNRFIDSGSFKTRRTVQIGLFALLRKVKRPIQHCSLREHVKNAYGVTLQSPAEISKVMYGVRKDNKFLCVDESKLPRNEKDYNEFVFVERDYIGYSAWPKNEISVPAAPAQQLAVPNDASQIDNPTVLALYEHFMNKDYVKSVLNFMSLEDNQHHGSFDAQNCELFRCLVRNFGWKFVENLIPYLDQMLEGRTEHEQRSAAELMCAIILGAKRWLYADVKKMHEMMIPRIEKALSIVTVETQSDWADFARITFTTGDTIRRHYDLFKVVLNIPSAENDEATFTMSSRLWIAQSAAFRERDWRRAQVYNDFLIILEKHLEKSYRDRVGIALSYLFNLQVPLSNLNRGDPECNQGPRLEKFIDDHIPELLCLKDGCEETDGEAKRKLLVFSAIVRMVIGHGDSDRFYRVPDNVFSMLPLLCRYESDTKDDRLRVQCRHALNYLASILLNESGMNAVLTHIYQVTDPASGQSWRGRVRAINHLQATVFNNLALLHSNESWRDDIAKIVYARLLNEQVEVREAAAELLTGLFRCGILKVTPQTVRHFEKLAQTNIKRKRISIPPASTTIPEVNHVASKSSDVEMQPTKHAQTSSLTVVPQENFTKRHAGVLGLCAIISSHPYTVPVFMPEILMDLRKHIHDPQPMQATTRKALSEFKRTHGPDWVEHKEKFNEDQLSCLTDLLVSPNYYA